MPHCLLGSATVHFQASEVQQLLHNKFVVILSDTIQRASYKGLVLLLQKDTAHSLPVKSQGDRSLAAMSVLGGCGPWSEKDHLPGMDLTVGVGLGGHGQLSFEQDQLTGGWGPAGRDAQWDTVREVRQFCFGSGHHLVRFFYFCVYSEYLEDVLEELSYGPAPDQVIIDSCLWDLSRCGRCSIESYRENLEQVFVRID